MTETTVYADASSSINANKNNGDFAGALSGAGSELISNDKWDFYAGQYWHTNNRANITQSFIEFDTSGISSGDTVSDVDLRINLNSDKSTDAEFDVLVAAFTNSPWSASDWNNATDLAALTDLVSLNTSGMSTGWLTFNSAALTTYINDNIGSTISIIIWSSRTESQSFPAAIGDYELVRFLGVGMASQTDHPHLIITHAAGSSTDNVTPSSIAATPSVGTPTLSQVVGTTPGSISSATSTGTPTLGQVHVLSPNSIAAASSLQHPTATGPATDSVTPSNIAAAANSGSPTIGVISALTPNGIASSPIIGAPTIGQTHAVTPTGLTASPVVGATTLGQTHEVAPSSIHSGVQFGRPTADKQALPSSDRRRGLSLKM